MFGHIACIFHRNKKTPPGAEHWAVSKKDRADKPNSVLLIKVRTTIYLGLWLPKASSGAPGQARHGLAQG